MLLRTAMEKALCCGIVYNESGPKEMLIEKLYESVPFSMRTNWGAQEDETLQNLAR